MKINKLLVLALTTLPVLSVFAQMESGDNVIIREKVNHDLYVAGGTVMINAPIDGDLIVAGGTVTVNDTIAQDVLVMGGTILINGFVGDDIRGMGGTIRLTDGIAGDIILAGGRINIDDGAVVNGNFLVSGGEVTLEGEVKGFIKSASGKFTLIGKAGNDVEIRGGKISINGTVDGKSILAANSIELGESAKFHDDIRYWNKEGALDFGNLSVSGQATFDSGLGMESDKWHYLGFASFLMVLWYLGTAFLMMFLIQYLFSNTLKDAAKTVKDASLKSLGLGFLFLIGVPVLIILTMVTFIGLPVGILILIGYISVLVFATVIVALLIANWINNVYYKATWGKWRIVLTAFGIFILLKFVFLTPFVGPLIMVLLVCMAFGGILQNTKWKVNRSIEVS